MFVKLHFEFGETLVSKRNVIIFAAPLSQFIQKSRLLWGFPHDSEIVGKSYDREIEAIVFDGPTNEKRPDNVIRFPGEEDDVDLSASFTPTMTFSPMPKPIVSTSGTFANCGSYTQNGVVVLASSNATVVTYPNGTQVLYSRCEVVQTLGDAG